MAKRKKDQPQALVFKLKDLNPAEYNPRTISDENFAALSASIEKFGLVEPFGKRKMLLLAAIRGTRCCWKSTALGMSVCALRWICRPAMSGG
jgi:hypothetical protein